MINDNKFQIMLHSFLIISVSSPLVMAWSSLYNKHYPKDPA